MLEVRNLDVSIGSKQILTDIDLTIADSEIVGVLGPSGSGKSTLLRAIAGLVEVSGGSVKWDGQEMTHVPTHKRNFGLMFQGYALFPHLDVGTNVGFGLEMSGADDRERRVSEALRLVGLEGYENRDVATLSGGEQQRVALARTMAPQPRLVMLDEPLGALDRNLRARLVVDTRQILERRDVTAIVVTHDRDEAVALTDRLMLMRDGRIVQTGRLDEMLGAPSDPWVEEFLS